MEHVATEREQAISYRFEELTKFMRKMFLDTFHLQNTGEPSTDAASGSGTQHPYQAYFNTPDLLDDSGFIKLFILVVIILYILRDFMFL